MNRTLFLTASAAALTLSAPAVAQVENSEIALAGSDAYAEEFEQ